MGEPVEILPTSGSSSPMLKGLPPLPRMSPFACRVAIFCSIFCAPLGSTGTRPPSSLSEHLEPPRCTGSTVPIGYHGAQLPEHQGAPLYQRLGGLDPLLQCTFHPTS